LGFIAPYAWGLASNRKIKYRRDKRFIMKNEIAEKVKKWLVDEGIYKDKLVDDAATHHFLVEMPPNSRQFIDVIFPKNREDMVIIASGLKLSDKHYKSLMSLSEDKRNEILWEIRFRLLFVETGFRIMPSLSDPQLFQFTRELYFDGLNKNMFMDALKQVHKCKLFIIWLMEKISGASGDIQPMYI